MNEFNNSLRRLLNGGATLKDAKLARDILNKILEDGGLDFECPPPQHNYCVGSCVFTPLDASVPRNFAITVFRDRTCLWTDTSGLQSASNYLDYTLGVILGDKRAMTNHDLAKVEFTIPGTLDDHAYFLVAELTAIMAEGFDANEEVCNTLDEALATHFSRDVNPFLPSKLSRK